jgi:hypothetical protein
MYVKCVAFQTSGERNIFEPRSVSQEFDVVFPPLPPDYPVDTFFVDVGAFAEITIVFYANPAPDTVVWHVVGRNDGESRQISAGSTVER